MILTLYRWGLTVGAPLVDHVLARRLARGKEDPARIAERRGVAGRPRPDGPLVWLHASSVGESVAALALVDRLLAADPARTVLMTSGTTTSASLLAKRLPERAIHQFVPVDRAAWVDRFLDHWRPDLLVLIENELWPNLLLRTKARGIPIALVNGRVSAASYRRWHALGPLVRPLFTAIDLALATNEDQARRLTKLGVHAVEAAGNIKLAADPLPLDPDAANDLRGRIGDRPVLVAASTHPGEDELVLEADATVRARVPGLLTIIVPRHPERGTGIEGLAVERGRRTARRASGGLPDTTTEIYVADTLGEMGVFLDAADIVFVAGSFVPVGGHNPIEPGHFGCAILFGPLMANNAEVAAEMIRLGAAREVADHSALAEATAALLSDPDARRAMADAARAYARSGPAILDRVAGRIEAQIATRSGR